MRLKTPYTVDAIPFPEHPTPQAERETWANLNGEWSLKKLSADGKELFSGQILVPFSPETLNSGIEEGFVLGEEERLVYERSFSLTSEQLSGKILLHFGAVDSECTVTLNGKEVGSHRCGFTAFAFDITDCALAGENTLVVTVQDNPLKTGGARGKQSNNPSTIWYTPQSGIWQTVWLEFMPKNSIDGLRITPFLERGSVTISFDCEEEVTVTLLDGEKVLESKTDMGMVEFKRDFELWSPENPKLYNLLLTNPSGDKIKSYFGYRSFSIVTDKQGKKRFGLNGKPYFYNGVLDQGYWSDGMLTYPCEKAVVDELTMLKNMGFNTVRKHIKVEPMRWYYHCDRLGLAVWQDFVNGGGEYNPWHVAFLPFLGVKHKDYDYKYFSREQEEGREEYIQMANDIVESLYNAVSVAVWVPFNEGWGQFESQAVTSFVESLDPTRIIDSVSGWHDQGKTETPVLSMHTYFTPLKVPKDPRPVVLSEFGGYSMKVSSHVFNEEKEFGYKKFKTQEALCEALEKLYLKKLLPLIKKGLSGCIYTQVSDVEEEINGLITYDRAVQKIPTEKMRAINDKLKSVWEQIE
jgi:beta-galactosidase/beta-glucuronidase